MDDKVYLAIRHKHHLDLLPHWHQVCPGIKMGIGKKIEIITTNKYNEKRTT